MVAHRTKNENTVSVRLSPETKQTLDRVLDANPDNPAIPSRSALLQHLVQIGLDSIVRAEPTPARTRAPLKPPQAAERAAGLMEALSDLIERVEQDSPDKAVVLARGIAKSSAAYADDLAARYDASKVQK